MNESISPEQVERATFGNALRGYDRDEVDVFLKKVADELRESQRLRSEKLYENLGDEIGNLLQHAKDSADAMTLAAEEEEARTKADAETAAREMRAAAERDAAQMRTDAENDAAATRSAADADAAATRANADRDATERITHAEAKVAELQEAEDALRDKLGMLRADLEVLVEQLRRLEHPQNEIRLDGQQEITLEAEPETAG